MAKAAEPKASALPKGRNLFFVEDDLVYCRFLSLAQDGTYRQINRDLTTATEADHGTWEQAADGSVRLHYTHAGLRFRVLRSGPLTFMVDSVDKVAALSETAVKIRRLLAESQDAVFEAEAAGALGLPPGSVAVDRQAETFRRAELAALANQMDDEAQVEKTHTYVLRPCRLPGRPLLLIQDGATFGPAQVEAVCQERRVSRGQAPPFYFAQTDQARFAKLVGRWQALQLPGDLGNP